MWRIVSAALFFMVAPLNANSQTVPQDNSEMTALFEADQETRRNLTPENMRDLEFVKRMIEHDARRLEETQELLRSGALSTANDYYHAAFIFQHGSTPDSYLLAHTLAVAATARGHERGPWIAAATLDRYLQETGREQIYGTQYSQSKGEWTLEPYDRVLVPDALREALGVPAQAAQDERLKGMRNRDGEAADSGS